MDEPKKLGRPSDFTQELADILCNEISDGLSLRSVCQIEGMPDKATVFRWLRERKDFRDQYARACEERTEAHNEDLLELGDEAISLAQSVDSKASSAVVQGVKLKADNLKWVMSKMKPKKYGDQIDITSGGEKLPTPIYNGVSGHNSNAQNIQP